MRFFFDSSALAKYYHQEPGSAWVSQLCQDSINSIFISRLSIVELNSVAAIKVRTGVISDYAADQFIRQIVVSAALGEFTVEPVEEFVFTLATQLLGRNARKNSLKTLDALQLASALLHKERHGLDHFVTSDQRLCAIAALEGLYPIDPANPETPPISSTPPPSTPQPEASPPAPSR